MSFTVDFEIGSGLPIWDPADISFTVDTYSWNVKGGPADAVIKMSGPDQAMWNATNLLRWGVKIRDRYAEPRWWGFIEGVEIAVGDIVWGASLKSIANRIKVLYTLHTTVDGNDTTSQAQTDWAEYTDSINVYGPREMRYSMQDATAAMATAQRDELLLYGHYPIGYTKPATSRTRAGGTLICRGHWSDLDNRYARAIAENDSQDVSEKIAYLLNEYGLFAGVDHLDYVATQTTRNISGENRALAEVEALLDGVRPRLIATVGPDRRVALAAEPLQGVADFSTGRDGLWRDANGLPIDPATCPVGVWRNLGGTIPTASINTRIVNLGREFITAARYDAKSGKISTTARDIPSVWDI